MLNFNGNTPKKILYNGQNVATLIFNGVKVWVSKVLTTLTGYPLTLSNSTGDDLEDYTVYGNSTQDGTPTPDTPIDVLSVGDLVTDESSEQYGKYKIPIVTRGKNLFSAEKLQFTDGYHVASGNGLPEAYTNTPRCATLTPLDVSGMESVTVSFELQNSYFMYSLLDASGIRLTRITGKVSGDTIDLTAYPTATQMYIAFYSATTSTISNIQVEEGSTATDYEPYTENTANIYLDEPLRKVGDYTDYVNFAEGKVVRNVLNFVPSGNDNWTYATSNARFTLSNTTFGNVGANGRTPILSNRFVFGLGSANYTALRYTSVIIIYYTEFTSADELNAYFAENPTYFLVALGKPTEEEIELPSVATTEGTCYVSIDTSVAPSDMSVAYYAN